MALKGENKTDQIFGKKVAREFTRFSKKEARLGGSNPNTFILRNMFSINPKSLNYYIIDDAVVKSFHCLYHQYSKEEIMEDEEVMATSFYHVANGQSLIAERSYFNILGWSHMYLPCFVF